MAENLITDYDRNIYKHYDRYRKASSATVSKLLDIIGKNKKVLSLGCGTGSFEVALSKNLDIAAIDLSKKMVKKAIDRGVNAKLGDMRNIKYDDDTFDAVYAIQSFHHVAENLNLTEKKRFDERLKVIKEAYRVLKCGGFFIIVQSDPKQNKALWIWHYFPEALERKLAIQPKIQLIKGMMRLTGFKKVDSEAYKDFSFRNFYDEAGPLKKEFRASYSEFSYLNAREIEKGCRLLKKDIKNRRVLNFIKKGEEKFDRLGGNLTMVYGKK